MAKARAARVITAIIITTISLSACNQNPDPHAVVYNTSVDVPALRWTSADTLFYPIVVAEEPNVIHPIRLRKNYHVRVSMRHDSNFPLTEMPATLYLQQTDSIEGQVRVSRRISQKAIAPAVRNQQSLPLGDGWGSLYSHQETISDYNINFDRAGNYRLLLIPNFKAATDGIEGMTSVGIELFE